MVVLRSGSLAKWLRVRVRARDRIRARECFPSFLFFFQLVLQNMMNMFVAVASYEYLIRWRNRFKPGELSLSLSLKHGHTLNTCIICRYIERVMSHKQKNHFGSRCEGWQSCSWWRGNCWCKFHSWGKCTMPLMNIKSDWMSKRFLWPVYYIGLY